MTRPVAYNPCNCCDCDPCPGRIAWGCPDCVIGTAEVDLSGWTIPDRTWIVTETQTLPFPQTIEREYTIKEFVRLRERICIGQNFAADGSAAPAVPVAEFCLCCRARVVTDTPSTWGDADEAIGTNGVFHQACKLIRLVQDPHAIAPEFFSNLDAAEGFDTAAILQFLGDGYLSGFVPAGCAPQTIELADLTPDPNHGPRVDEGQITIAPVCCSEGCNVIACPDAAGGFTCGCELPPTARLQIEFDTCEWCWMANVNGAFVIDPATGLQVPGFSALYYRVRWLNNPSPLQVCIDLQSATTVQQLAANIAEVDELTVTGPGAPADAPDCLTAFANNGADATTAPVNLSAQWQTFPTGIYADVFFEGISVLGAVLRFGFIGQAKIPCAAIEGRQPVMLEKYQGVWPQPDTCPSTIATAPPENIATNFVVQILEWCCGDPAPPCPLLTNENWIPDCASAAGWQLIPTPYYPNPAWVWACAAGFVRYIFDPITGEILEELDLTSLGLGIDTTVLQQACP